jgi:hypothetical protein
MAIKNVCAASKMKKSVAEVVFLRARADFMISRTGEVVEGRP